jgi:hypothetical protein
MTDWHAGLTWRTDMTDWHDGLTWRTDMTDWHDGLTWRIDMADWHDGLTWRTDMTDWHNGLTWRIPLLSVYKCSTPRSSPVIYSCEWRYNYIILNDLQLNKEWYNKGKSKVHHRTGHEVPEGEKRYNSTLSITSVLHGVGGQRHAPAALSPVPIV